MAYFPQLQTGNSAQYPAVKRRRARTIANDAIDGQLFSLADASAEELEWDLTYGGLSGAEREMFETFFAACEGRLETFVFPDPLGNLLAMSEDPSVAPWQKDPLMQFTPGQADPNGGTAAVRAVNAAGIAQAFRQSVDIPGDRRCCVSFWAKAASGGSVTVRRTAGGSSSSQTAQLTTQWSRHEFSSALGTGLAPSVFSIELSAGAVADFFGFQVETQEAASGYRRTTVLGEVYPKARFEMDELTWMAEGIDSFGTTLRIRSAVAR